jgi:hypothetical protein
MSSYNYFSVYKSFNINQHVKVQLTDYGRKLYQEFYDSERIPYEDSYGWSTWQMWELMEIYGEHLGLTNKNPFNLNILIEFEYEKGKEGSWLKLKEESV